MKLKPLADRVVLKQNEAEEPLSYERLFSIFYLIGSRFRSLRPFG